MKYLVSILTGLAFTAVLAKAQVAIDTITPWNKTFNVQTFGFPYIATYGQTITAPAGQAFLNSFTFEMNLPSSETFRGYVYAWDGTKATGSALYSSPVTSTAGSGHFQAITFNTGGVSVTPGLSYVLFASISGVPGSTGTGGWGFDLADIYAGGQFVFLDSDNDVSLWTSTAWANAGGQDAAFQANFSPVPESTTPALTALGGLALGALRRRNSFPVHHPKDWPA